MAKKSSIALTIFCVCVFGLRGCVSTAHGDLT